MLVTACTRIAKTLEQFIFFGFPMADKWLKKNGYSFILQCRCYLTHIT